MSANRLDMVDTLDQLSFSHWKALGTKLGGVENVKAILRGTFAVKVDIIRRLTTLTSVLVAGKDVNLHAFFRTRSDLHIEDNFKEVILSDASKRRMLTNDAAISYADVVQDANDAEIGAELPEGYVFRSVDMFLARLAAFIDGWQVVAGQRVGGMGVLLQNGCANIFYVKVNGEVVAVDVCWIARFHGWRCSTYPPGDSRRNTGDRVFSATVA